MSWDIDRDEFDEAVEREDWDWLWSAYQALREELGPSPARPDVLARDERSREMAEISESKQGLLAVIGAAEAMKAALVEAMNALGFDGQVALQRAKRLHTFLGKIFEEADKRTP